jgi:uncharacterized membrane protein
MSDLLKESPDVVAPPKEKNGRIWARATALVHGRPADLYALWRDIESAPQWQEMIADVIATGPRTSHWVMRAEGKTAEWESEILADEPGRRIAWRVVAGDSNNAGEVVFEPAPGGRGTVVTLFQELRQGEAKTVAEAIFCRNPKQAVIEDLRRFKTFAETRWVRNAAA